MIDAFLMRVSLPNPSPQISSVFPDSILLDASNNQSSSVAGWNFSLTGQGFAYGTQVAWNGQPVTSVFNSSNQLSAGVVLQALVQAGANTIGASLPGPGGGVSSPVTVTGYNPAPEISISPASVNAGAAETKVIVSGSGLSAASVLTWNGSVRPATFVPGATPQAGGHLSLLIEPPELAQPSTSTITVTNPGPGGGLSLPVSFVVQATSGAGVSSVSGPGFIEIDDSTTASSAISLSGSGFTTSSVAFWDGAAVPSALVSSTQLAITPPAGALSVVGHHSVQVSNGTLASPALPLLVIRTLPLTSFQVYDSVHQLVYMLVAPQTNGGGSDLAIYDAVTGEKTGGTANIISTPQAMAVSDDGSYLYIAGGVSNLEISRFNAAQGAVDLDWQVFTPATFYGAAIAGLATITGAPESLAVLVNDTNANTGAILFVYDRDRPRALTGSSFLGNLYLPSMFASSSRVFINGVVSFPCLEWWNFDAAGVESASAQCGMNPPELTGSHGFQWLTDGNRTTTVSAPAGAGGLTLSWQVDPVRRLADAVLDYPLL